MNGLAQSRRASSPIRLTLARRLGSGIDGAWWPHTASIASELPDLVGAMHRPLGEIVDIKINWKPTDGQRDLQTIAARTGVMRAAVTEQFRPRLMVVSSANKQAKLLVVPSMTSQALGLMVLRAAAGMPAVQGSGDPWVFETAKVVVSLAMAEIAEWCGELCAEQVAVAAQ